MALKDYNGIAFKNTAIDKMSKNFNKSDEPDPKGTKQGGRKILPDLLSAIGAGVGTAIFASEKGVARRDERYKKRQEKKKEKSNN